MTRIPLTLLHLKRPVHVPGRGTTDVFRGEGVAYLPDLAVVDIDGSWFWVGDVQRMVPAAVPPLPADVTLQEVADAVQLPPSPATGPGRRTGRPRTG